MDRVKAGRGTGDDTVRAAWFETIRRDVEEHTWKDLGIFQSGAPLHQSLVDVLSAYAMYRSDIGYVSGCNTIAALLLINLPTPSSTFVALANILNRSLPLSFYTADPGAKSSAYNLLLQTLSTKSATLHNHITQLPEHNPDIYLDSIFTSLFTGQLALDQAARLWDVYVFEGDSVLVRAGVAMLLRREMPLLRTQNIEEVSTVLKDNHDEPSVVGRHGEEDNWMRLVREAGKV